MQKGAPDSGAAAPPAGGFTGKLPVADLPLFRFPFLVELILPGEECFGSLSVTVSVIGRRYRDVPDGPEKFVQERLPALFEIVMPAAKEKVVLFSEEGRHQQEVVPKVEEREAVKETLGGKRGGLLRGFPLGGGKRWGVKNVVGVGRKENGHGKSGEDGRNRREKMDAGGAGMTARIAQEMMPGKKNKIRSDDMETRGIGSEMMMPDNQIRLDNMEIRGMGAEMIWRRSGRGDGPEEPDL